MTRERLLRSAIRALAEDGFAATTVAAVAQRAGVSRGAAQHHYPTRESLITAALEQLFEDLMDSASAGPTDVAQGSDRVRQVVGRAVDIYTGTEFKAALQVWAAAASDPALRSLILPLEEKFARVAHQMTVAALDPAGGNPQTHRVAQVTLDLARGLGLADTLSDDSKRRAQVVDTWTDMVIAELARQPR